MSHTDGEKVVVEVEDFIAKVQMKPCLWDHKNANYFKRDVQIAAWMEIADETLAPVRELKKRWRNLRDTFCRELRKLDGRTDGRGDELVSSWRHFRRLLFLKDVVSTVKKPKRWVVRTATRDSESNESEDDIRRSRSSSSEAGDPLSSTQAFKQEPLSPVRLFKQEPGSEDPRVKRLKGSNLSRDSDAQFLLSMLPFMREVPRRRKLLVRAKLMQVLMDEQSLKT